MAKAKLVRLHILYIVAAAAVGGVFYVSVIYCITNAGKYLLLSLHLCEFSGKMQISVDSASVQENCIIFRQ